MLGEGLRTPKGGFMYHLTAVLGEVRVRNQGVWTRDEYEHDLRRMEREASKFGTSTRHGKSWRQIAGKERIRKLARWVR